MIIRRCFMVLLTMCVALSLWAQPGSDPPASESTVDTLITLLEKYQRISQNIDEYGPGGRIVLDVAYFALAKGKAKGKWPLVSIEDLWAHAIKEGRSLFNKPEKRWGRTTAEETHDMIGQTTIGPWQITVENVKNIYGPPYGVQKEWTNNKVNDYCREHPEIQAMMISDYIQKSYEDYGVRSPYAIQRYFWLEAYAKGEIGQGPWDNSPVAVPPSGNWKDITPEMKRNTGFYAKQILLGSKYNQHGLLYWLYVTKDTDAIKDVFRTWKTQVRHVWKEDRAVPTGEPGNFAITPADFKYCTFDQEFHQTLLNLLKEVDK
jgi:hypothetical protein